MAKTNGHGMESLALRRASLTDSDKVRYRVYRTADDFIAVIAESALMAVKVSGIEEPYRIVRDLPTEGVAIKADRMSKQDVTAARVSLPTAQVNRKAGLRPHDENPKQAADFVPMQLRDLEKKQARRMRILSPKDLETMAVAPLAKPLPPPPPLVEAVPLPAEVAGPVPSADADSDTLTPEQVAALLKE